MTNFEKIKAMSVEELAYWLNENIEVDDALWMIWFNKNYCDNCESEYKFIPAFQRECECCYCELNDKCRFFPEKAAALTLTEIIALWLNAEVTDGK